MTYCCGMGKGDRQARLLREVEGLGTGFHLSSPHNHCCFSDLRGRSLRGPVVFLVATAAVKPTRQHRDMVLNLSVSSQLGEAACRYCSARCSPSSRAHRQVAKASILRSLREEQGLWEGPSQQDKSPFTLPLPASFIHPALLRGQNPEPRGAHRPLNPPPTSHAVRLWAGQCWS